MAKKWTVYKIVASEGDYIGVTSRDPRYRLYENRCRRGIDGPLEIIAEFETRDEAFLLERELVPDLNLGLNRMRGGRNQGYPGNHNTRPKRLLYGGENPSSLRVKVGTTEYETIQAAADAYGIKKTAAHYRFASPYFSDWVYLDPPRASYWQDKQAKQKRKPAISAVLRRL
jgi:hypothetical protein